MRQLHQVNVILSLSGSSHQASYVDTALIACHVSLKGQLRPGSYLAGQFPIPPPPFPPRNVIWEWCLESFDEFALLKRENASFLPDIPWYRFFPPVQELVTGCRDNGCEFFFLFLLGVFVGKYALSIMNLMLGIAVSCPQVRFFF